MISWFILTVVFAIAALCLMLSIPTWVYTQKTSKAFQHPRLIAGLVCCGLSALCVFGLLGSLPA